MSKEVRSWRVEHVGRHFDHVCEVTREAMAATEAACDESDTADWVGCSECDLVWFYATAWEHTAEQYHQALGRGDTKLAIALALGVKAGFHNAEEF